VRILGIVDKVEGAVDAEIEAQFPSHMGTAVTITLSDGSARCARVMDSRGTPANPLSLDELTGKAQGLMRDVDPHLDITATRARIWGETDGRAVARLFAATASAPLNRLSAQSRGSPTNEPRLARRTAPSCTRPADSRDR